MKQKTRVVVPFRKMKRVGQTKNWEQRQREKRKTSQKRRA